MRYITEVHMSGGTGHEHIAEVRWSEPAKKLTGSNTRAEMVSWINNGGDARVKDGQGEVKVVVVKATPPHLRTIKDDRYTDNLLALPKY